MQFDDVVGRNAGSLMQIVDILRDHARHLAGAVEAGQRPVAAAGLAPARNCSSMAKRRRQASSRISWLARKSSNGIGWFLVHRPPGERKSGMPHSVEMPAPVNGTITLRVLDQLAQARDGGLKIGRDHYYSARAGPGRAVLDR